MEGDGQVEEPHRSQPVPQGSQERHQEASEASPHFNQRDGPQVPAEPKVRQEAQQHQERISHRGRIEWERTSNHGSFWVLVVRIEWIEMNATKEFDQISEECSLYTPIHHALDFMPLSLQRGSRSRLHAYLISIRQQELRLHANLILFQMPLEWMPLVSLSRVIPLVSPVRLVSS
ncbi:Ribosomal L29e protein family [Prunus dulcis]|uniref:Ribosomal L29e protein family n=1 Tax=Prunus dulcis TaxID=3755 RepID=A0A4Y1QMT4_PRUDU|nr:Ribosomal L29e protein family [Prunus dulcis]